MPAADKPSDEELAALVMELSARLERAEARIAELEDVEYLPPLAGVLAAEGGFRAGPPSPRGGAGGAL